MPAEAPRDAVEPLILDLLEWLAAGPRPYTEVMAAWRTSCPRLPVWEDASERGYIRHERAAGGPALVGLSDEGARHLERCRPTR